MAMIPASPSLGQDAKPPAPLGVDPVDNTPQQFAAWLGSESAKWGKVIRDANIRAD